jgi:predicted nicotinamide N-methyase
VNDRNQVGATEAFVRANTAPVAPPHVPEVVLHLADEAHDLWHLTEEQLEEKGLPPPFWAFAWAGGQGLSRYILDNPESVSGKSVLDFAAGSGLVGIAAARAGARSVLCADVDPFCAPAVALNARLNDVEVVFSLGDLVDADEGWDVVLAGDVFYDRAFAARLIPWFSALADRGAAVLLGDPGRAYLPKERISQLAEYQVPVTRALEDSDVKRTRVWRYS